MADPMFNMLATVGFACKQRQARATSTADIGAVLVYGGHGTTKVSLLGQQQATAAAEQAKVTLAAGQTVRGMVRGPTIMSKWGPLGSVAAYAR